MSEDREQERAEERDASRPVTAAARRERRASARPAARQDRASRAVGSKAGGATEGGNANGAKGRPTPSRERRESKGSPFKRLGRFVREVVAELRKVIWPTRKQLVTYTAVVLVFVAFMVLLVAGLDFAFGKGMLWLFG
ncbi:preprotein translocase subunit SecE [Streptoalloteichus hindustanus]|uniref:Protein translocase subunit SecE n=1 Tax=Streptoalloteichus hindustanus TaxID=2017 RepID=A0A1M4TKV4_STRHI|nr:preprotein translocase subunit SecE [Streptoalloteichus hindustanus]SHE45142.1 preprotein translocase subunit SecE [Streptoalloteichus hindustanus]